MPLPAALRNIADLRRGPVARGAVASLAIRMAALGLGFGQAVLTARLLGPEGYGVVAVAISVATIAATAATLGMAPLAVREVAQLAVRQDWGRLRGFLRFSARSVLLAALAGAGLIAALALATPVFGPAFRGTVAAAAPMVVLLALLALMRGQCQGFGRVVAAQAPGELLRPAILVAALGLLLATAGHAEPRSYVLAALLAALAGLVVAAVLLRRITAAAVPPAPPVLAPRGWRRAARPFLGIAFLGIVGTEANTLLLGWLAGPEEAGLYQPIARLAPIMLIATEALSVPLAPRLAELWERGEIRAIRSTLAKTTLAATVATIGLVIGLVVLAPVILGAFGREFLANAHLLVWIAIAQVFNAGMGRANLLLDMTGRMKLRTAAQIATLLVQVGVGLVLVGPFGASGAVAALVAAIIVWSFANWLLAIWFLRIDTSLSQCLRLRS